ncbi:ankyrin repeat containing protein [Finch poxvirus]|uniref:Ankyrin repeat containing protein n=1 Tax=Condorpox virus TaxID=3049970 RepID=A0AAT9UQ08_9POXV|nr:ankyrin repeat containing protein [Finch poxvirus]UOX38876.1 ankyrin repeat containing protein [Finch poxvirus]
MTTLYELYLSMYKDTDKDTILSIIDYEGLREFDHYEKNELIYLHKIILSTKEYGINKTNTVYFPYSPLNQAVEARRYNIVEYLLNRDKKKYHVNKPMPYMHNGYRPLHVLTMVQDVNDVLTYLKATDSIIDDVNKLVDKANSMKLSKSVSVGIIKEVLRGNKYLSDDELRCLERHINEEEVKIARLLIRHGADINILSEYGYSALMSATLNGNLSLVKLLLSKKARHSPDVLMRLSVVSRNVNLAEEIYYRFGHNNKNDSILCIAARLGDENMVNFLLRIGTDVNVREFDGLTPINNAVLSGSIECVNTLILHGADVNISDKLYYRSSPLKKACNMPVIAKLLLDNGADPNAISNVKASSLYMCNNNETAVYIISNIVLQERSCSINNEEGYNINMEIIKGDPLLMKIKMDCEKEIERMKLIRLNNCFSLDIFIISKDVNLLSILVNCSVLENLDLLCFPIYNDNLIRGIHSGIKRKKILDESCYLLDKCLKASTWSLIPLEIKYKILTEIKDDDMLSIIKRKDEDKMQCWDNLEALLEMPKGY